MYENSIAHVQHEEIILIRFMLHPNDVHACSFVLHVRAAHSEHVEAAHFSIHTQPVWLIDPTEYVRFYKDVPQ